MSFGEVAEWLKAHAWKVCIRFIAVSRVRIPVSPPNKTAPDEGLFYLAERQDLMRTLGSTKSSGTILNNAALRRWP